jgi:hypothetical protein
MSHAHTSRAGRPKLSAFDAVVDDEQGPAQLCANPFVRLLDQLINASSKAQRQIAFELGYARANIITMFKQGTTRLPFEKVGPMAVALDADPVHLIRTWLEKYEPAMLPILEQNFGNFLSAEELAWLLERRESLMQPADR